MSIGFFGLDILFVLHSNIKKRLLSKICFVLLFSRGKVLDQAELVLKIITVHFTSKVFCLENLNFKVMVPIQT